jgi:hypothetical protein
MAYRSRRSSGRRAPARRPSAARRSVRRVAPRRAVRGRSASRSGQTLRIVVTQGAPQPMSVMRDPIGGSQLVMPGSPRPRRARF